jgi:hypothetical protein
MWEFVQGYGIWILLGLAALYLFAGGCGRGAGMGCGGHSRHSHRQRDRRPIQRELEDVRDDEPIGTLRNGQPHH